MESIAICLNCFQFKGDYEVCPYCGFIEGTLPAQVFHLHPGTMLNGRYMVGVVLGFGGFGVTYKAWDRKLSTVVAIKEFYPSGLVNRIPGEKQLVVFSGDKRENFHQQMSRFLDEAKHLAKFNGDPHIVNVLDFFEENNTAYIVMEYLDGQTLKAYMAAKGGKLAVEEGVRVAQAVADGLTSIHAKGIIHRDISPDNIYILNNGQVKLLDFGAARLSAEEGDATRSVVIKLGYAPPEQYRSKMKQGAWTDVYALGATLYKMVTGVTPDESVDRMEQDGLQRPSRFGLSIDPQTEKVIMKAMALKPELRFQAAPQFKQAILNRQQVDFPEDEIKKRKTFRNVAVALSFALLIALGCIIGFAGGSGEGEGLAGLEIAPGEINWLVGSSTELRALYEGLVEQFERQYPDYRINLVSSADYGGYRKAFETLSQEGRPPAVYWGKQAGADSALPLDLLLASIQQDDYFFMDQYETYFPEKTRMPVGFNVLVCFANTALTNGETPITDFSLKSLAENTTSFGTPYTCLIPGAYLPYYYDLFYNPKGTLTPGVFLSPQGRSFFKDLNAYYGQQGLHLQEKNSPFQLFSAEKAKYLIDSSFHIRDRQETLPGYYDILPVTHEGKMLGIFQNEFSINRHVSENEQHIAMLFLGFLMSEYNKSMYAYQGGATIPLNKETFKSFTVVNPELKFVENYIDKMVFANEQSFIFPGNEVTENILTQPLTGEEIDQLLDTYFAE